VGLMDKQRNDFLALETALHKKHIRNSSSAVSELLADEFIEFGSSGRIFNKSTIIELLKTEVVDQQVSVEDFAVQELAATVVLVKYIAAKPSEHQGAIIRTLRSSIWQLIDERWQMIFHQGTRIPG
jgi:hypothetical protein